MGWTSILSQLFWCEQKGFPWVLTHCHLDLGVPWWLGWFLHLEHGDRIFQNPGRWRPETNQFLMWSLRFGSPKNGSNQQSGGIASSNGISGIWDGQLDMISKYWHTLQMVISIYSWEGPWPPQIVALLSGIPRPWVPGRPSEDAVAAGSFQLHPLTPPAAV